MCKSCTLHHRFMMVIFNEVWLSAFGLRQWPHSLSFLVASVRCRCHVGSARASRIGGVFSGCQNPQCSKSNEVAIQVGPSLHRGKGKGGKTKAFAKKVPPGVERRKRSRERTPSWPACKMLKLASLQDAEVGQGWTDNKDIIDHLKHDPYFVQGEADNKDVDVGQGSADNQDADVGQGSAGEQDADVGQGSADKSKANKAKKKMKKKKQEDDVSKKPKKRIQKAKR